MRVKTFIIRTISILFIFLFTLTSFITFPRSTVSAEEPETQYTGVLEDLERDDSFNPEDYPVKENDFSIEFIGLSESSKEELFVYVYVPSGDESDIQATSINISQEHKDVDFDNYTLSLISKDGVFHKYKVEDLKVSSDSVRYYEISSIFKKYDKVIDGFLGPSFIITEFPYKVGKSYRLIDISGNGYDVYVEDIDLIRVEDRYVGFMRYPDGGHLFYTGAVDVHFIAFSTDLKIDQLQEADLIYTSRSVSISGIMSKASYGEPKENKVTVNYKNDLTFNGTGWLYKDKYSWPSIETASSFLETESKGQHYTLAGIFDVSTSPNISSGTKKDIEDKDWVIRYTTTSYTKKEVPGIVGHTDFKYTVMSDVSILRLAFETDDVYYNLGVVDVKSTPSEKPSNEGTHTEVKLTDDFMDWVKKILAMIAGLGLIVLVVWLISLGWPIISIVLRVLWAGIKILLKIIIWLILFPFNVLGALFKKIKEKRQERKIKKINKK